MNNKHFTIKHWILFILLLGVFSPSYGQNCKPFHSGKDEFSGERVEHYGAKLGNTRSWMNGVSTYARATIYEEDGKERILFNIQMFQSTNDALLNDLDVSEGTEFMLRTSQGILEFTAQESARQKKTVGGGKIVTAFNLISEINRENIAHLSKYPIMTYKVIPVKGNKMQAKVKPKKAQKFIHQVNCYINKSTTGSSWTPANSSPADESYSYKYDDLDVNSFIGLQLGFSPFYTTNYHRNSALYTLNYEHGINEQWSVEGFIGFGSSYHDYYVGLYIVEFTYSHMHFGAMANFFPYRTENLDLYLNGGFGINKTRQSDLNIRESETRVILGGGVRYNFDSDLSTYAEIGTGVSAFNLGLLLRI